MHKMMPLPTPPLTESGALREMGNILCYYPPPTEYGSRKMSATTPPPTESFWAKLGLPPPMDVGSYAYEGRTRKTGLNEGVS